MKQKQMREIVKVTPIEELHKTYTKMLGFFEMFSEVVKSELIAQLEKKKKKTGDGSVSTNIGKIQLMERHNYIFDEKEIKKFIAKMNIAESDIFDFDYAIVSKNEKKLRQLVKEGIVSVDKKISVKKIEKIIEKYPKLLNFIEDKPTKYIKGL
jgi:hypothetical protein